MKVTINGNEVEVLEGDELEVLVTDMDCGTWKETSISALRSGQWVSLTPE